MMDVQSPPEVGRNDINSPVIPKEESITTVNLAPSPYAPLIQETPPDQIFQQNYESFPSNVGIEDNQDPNPSDTDPIEQAGGIILNDPPYEFTVDVDDLGETYDGKYIADILKEGAGLNIDGAKIEMTYKNGYRNEIGYFKISNEQKVSKIFPYIFFLPEKAYGRSYDVMQYPLPFGGGDYTYEMWTRADGGVYVVIPVITAGTNQDILPPRVEKDENGKERIVNEVTDRSFPIEGDNAMGLTEGNLSWAIGKLTPDMQLEMFGFLDNSSDGSGIYVYEETLPPELKELIKG